MALTARRIIVCNAALATAANALCKQVDTVGGQYTFNVLLRAAGDATNTTIAYWCSCIFDPTVLAMLKTKTTAAGFTRAEITERLLGFSATPATLPRIAIFDDAAWAPDQVLTALGLALSISTI